jgi:hypothetical protein
VGLGFSLLLPSQARAGEKVNFDTVDGVSLEGTYWPSKMGIKAPCVLLLHNFEVKKGGSRNQEGWESLATVLNDKGYAVLSFDFRGHGNSTAISPSFWNAPHNQMLKGFRLAKKPTTINQVDFYPAYYKYLVNDVAAAKAYLDRENDNMALNSKNMIVIGAGEGATIGAMWMASEFKRFKATTIPVGVGFPPRVTGLDADSEGRDLMAGIWLSISPTLAGQTPFVTSWLIDIGKTHKLPMVFIYGKDDTQGDAKALATLKAIIPNFDRSKPADKEYAFTGEKAIPGTKLKGHQLLQKSLETENWILNNYIAPLQERHHKFRQWGKKDYDESTFYWSPTVPPPTNLSGLHEAKAKGEKAPKFLPTGIVK